MVAFRQTMGGNEVLVNEKPFGYISKERGFFTDPTVVKCFMEVSITDFQAIQDKIREVTRPRVAEDRLDRFIFADEKHA